MKRASLGEVNRRAYKGWSGAPPGISGPLNPTLVCSRAGPQGPRLRKTWALWSNKFGDREWNMSLGLLVLPYKATWFSSSCCHSDPDHPAVQTQLPLAEEMTQKRVENSDAFASLSSFTLCSLLLTAICLSVIALALQVASLTKQTMEM